MNIRRPLNYVELIMIRDFKGVCLLVAFGSDKTKSLYQENQPIKEDFFTLCLMYWFSHIAGLGSICFNIPIYVL